MSFKAFPAALFVLLVGVLSAPSVFAPPARATDRLPLRQDADSLVQKIAGIRTRALSTSRAPVRTLVTERELNAYLAYEFVRELPTGVVDPSVAIVGLGRIEGRAVVDLDRVRKERRPTSRFDPFYYLTGRLPVTATGVLKTNGGTGRFELESASVSGVAVPTLVVEQIVGYYSRSAERPSGIDLDVPFELPAHIREIQVARGQAVVVQQ